MSAGASSGTGGVATGVVKSSANRVTGYARNKYWHGERKKLTALLVTMWIVGFFIVAFAMSIVLTPLTIFIGDVSGIAGWIGVIVTTGTVGWVFYQARKDAKQRKRVVEYQERPTPETAADAVSMLDSTDPEVRGRSSYVVADVCEFAPGKIVKQYPREASEIVDRLIPLLDDSDRNARVNAAAALVYFARDYPQTVIEHKDIILNTLKYPDSGVQRHSTITAGNLGAAYPDQADECCEALARVLNDEDPDVRGSACIGLGQPSLERASELLRNMTNDPNPDVREAASEAIGIQQGQQETVSDGTEGAAGARTADQDDQDSSSNEFVNDPPDLDFSDIAGMGELKTELEKKIIDPFDGNDVYEKYGVSADSGILFHGPPGTGKTYLSKALAGELDINYVSADVGDLDSKYIGEGVENIKQMFSEARQNQPCLIFLDEIDALAADRSGSQNDDKKKMVNQLLQEVGDLDADDDLIVIAATNNPDDIDDAMLRTGRFDSKIEIPPPDADARVDIFQEHMDAPTEEEGSSEFRRATQGFVASDMVVIARRAALQAADREQETGQEGIVTHEDVMEAIDGVASERGSIGEFVQRPPDMDFSDVAGMKELKHTLRTQIIEPLDDPEFHEQYGLGVETGILFHGPPGTGKTHTAKALAGELDINYINAKAGDLVSKWIGEGAQNVQQMFDEARQNQPCLIFIDEIDALATDRNSAGQQKSERQMVNQFLEELSQLSDDDEDVIVIGATNRIDDIDSAMLRTGRFTKKIEVPPPDQEARIAIFQMHLEAPQDGLELGEIGKRTEGFVASDMQNVAQQAARTAMQRARSGTESEHKNGQVTQEDVIEAITDVRQGRAAAG